MAKDPSSLPILIDLAKDNADKAGKALRQLTAERSNAESQLSALQSYRQDYAERLQKATQAGLSASNYHNFRQFIATLDEAISQQNKLVAQIDGRLEDGRRSWYAEKRRLNSYEALQARQAQQRRALENRAEQLAADEVSAAMYRRLRPAH